MEYLKSCLMACSECCLKCRQKRSTDSTKHIIIPVHKRHGSWSNPSRSTYAILTQPDFSIPLSGDERRRGSLPSQIRRKSSTPPLLTSAQMVQPQRKRSILPDLFPSFSVTAEEDGEHNNNSDQHYAAESTHYWRSGSVTASNRDESSPSHNSMRHLSVGIGGVLHSRRSSWSSFEISREEVDSELYGSSDQLLDGNSLGRLCFNYKIDSKTGNLYLTIVCARNLVMNGAPAQVDSCVKVSFATRPKKAYKNITSIQKQTCNPNYNETIIIEGINSENLEDQLVTFSVFVFDKHSRRSTLGSLMYQLDLDDLSDDGEGEQKRIWRHIYPEGSTSTSTQSNGSLMVSMCYLPAEKQLQVNIVKATDLPIKKTTKPLEGVYVKLALFGHGQILDKQKTRIISPATAQPVFDQSFGLHITGTSILDQCCVVVSVCGKTSTGKRCHLGYISLGPPFFANGSGLEHWTKIMSLPYTFVGKWHPLSEWKDGDSRHHDCKMF